MTHWRRLEIEPLHRFQFLVAFPSGSSPAANPREQACPLLLTEPVAFGMDVQDVAVGQQPVQNGRGDHRVTQDLAPPLLEVRIMLDRS